MTGDRVIRFTTAAVVCAVAAFAAVVSASHIYGLGRAHGQDGTAARLLPLSVDGLILAASLVLLHEARNDRDAPALARFMLWLGIGATIGANVAYGAGYGLLGALISAWPAVAFMRGGGRLSGRCPGWCGAGHGRRAVRCPGGAGSLLPGPCGSGLAPGLARRGTRAWQAGKEPDDAAPFTYLPFAASGGAVTVSCSGRSYHGLPSLCLLSRSSQSPYVPSCARFVTDSVVRPVA